MGRELWKVRFRDGRQCFSMVFWRHKVGHNVREDIHAMQAKAMCQPFIFMRKKDRVICLKYQIGWRNRFIASIRGSKQETGDRSGKRCDREQNPPESTPAKDRK